MALGHIHQLLSALLAFIFLMSISSFKNANALDTRRLLASEELQYHTIQISSLRPESSACKPSSKDSKKRKASLEVVHRYGACSGISEEKPNKKPTMAEILSRDQARVSSIKDRLSSAADHLNKKRFSGYDEEKTTLPAELGASLGTANYVTKIGIGTPKQDLNLVFDTGSDITWTQCQPCEGSCYSQRDQIFDPAESTTYKNIPCSSSTCSELQSTPTCLDDSCGYERRYGDGSFTQGYLSQETITLAPDTVLDNIPFGCGQNNKLLGDQAIAGLMGLSGGSLSIISLTEGQYGKFFSYCLPTPDGSGGYLTFGNTNVEQNVQYTPLASSGSDIFYKVTITGISVGGKVLDINTPVPPTIVDSGTVVTRLPSSAYIPLRDAFREAMSQYKAAQPAQILDTCYDLSETSGSISVPTISFFFSGNAKVDIDPHGILIAGDLSQVCLAFAEDSANIFGNLQQQTYQVLYDLPGGQIGFAPNGCS